MRDALMRNREILETALAQSALECGCAPEDFFAPENRAFLSRYEPRARRYLETPAFCELVSYGGSAVASAAPEFLEEARAYISGVPADRCFEPPRIHLLEETLGKYGRSVCFLGEYFLPDMEALRPLSCPLPVRILGPEELAGWYAPEWGMALTLDCPEADVLAAGAFDGGALAGLAACSADCAGMWQIGVDVAPPYRRQGIAAALVSRLAEEILSRGKVPFYCCAWSNLASARTAYRAGFRPAWVQLTAKSAEFARRLARG